MNYDEYTLKQACSKISNVFVEKKEVTESYVVEFDKGSVRLYYAEGDWTVDSMVHPKEYIYVSALIASELHGDYERNYTPEHAERV